MYTAYLFLTVYRKNGKEERKFDIYSEDCPTVFEGIINQILLMEESGSTYSEAREKLVNRVKTLIDNLDHKPKQSYFTIH